MPRVRRSDLPDGVFHVTARGVDGCAIFRDDVDRVTFLRILAGTVDRDGWRVLAFCLLSNHYHLVVDTTRRRLSAGVQHLSGMHAQRFNRRHNRTGHLFGGRFAARVIDGERRLAATLDYVRQNPVRAGLVREADEWPWTALAPRRPPQSEQAFVRPQSYTDPTWPPKSWSSTAPASTT